jgi:hypothetical protein
VRFALAILVVAGCQKPDQRAVGAANCARVAETLASFEAGSGVTAEQRAPVVAKHQAACEAMRVTADEAACLARAPDTWAARACLPRMFPPKPTANAANVGAECQLVATRMGDAVMSQVGSNGSAAGAKLDQMLPIIAASCELDRWPAPVVQCIAATKVGDMAAYQACSNQLPIELQKKLAARLAQAK